MEKGDKVRFKDPHGRMIGWVYEFVDYDKQDPRWCKVMSEDGAIGYAQTIHIEKVKGEAMSGCKCHSDSERQWDSYSFDIRSGHQVNYNEIRECLTVDNPMMIVEYEDSDLVEIVVHKSLWHKASHCGPEYTHLHRDEWFPEAMVLTQKLYLYQLEGYCYGPIPRRYINEAVELLRTIRDAEWDDRRPTTVTVRKVKI